MDIPCAIVIAAFCLPDAGLKMEVKSDISGATAIASFGEVRASIVLPSEFDAPERTALDKQLCPADYCIPYAARLRSDASAVDLLIADPAGREHFIQIKGPVDQIAALSSRMSFVYQMGGRWERVALSEFKVSEAEPAAASPEQGPQQGPEQGPDQAPGPPPPGLQPDAVQEPGPGPGPEPGYEPPPEPGFGAPTDPNFGPPPEPPPPPQDPYPDAPPQTLFGPPPVDAAPLPDVAPVPEFGPGQRPPPQSQDPREWPTPNRPY